MYWETKKFVTCFIVMFTLQWWSGTEPTISPKYACIFLSHWIFVGEYTKTLKHLPSGPRQKLVIIISASETLGKTGYH